MAWIEQSGGRFLAGLARKAKSQDGCHRCFFKTDWDFFGGTSLFLTSLKTVKFSMWRTNCWVFVCGFAVIFCIFRRWDPKNPWYRYPEIILGLWSLEISQLLTTVIPLSQAKHVWMCFSFTAFGQRKRPWKAGQMPSLRISCWQLKLKLRVQSKWHTPFWIATCPSDVWPKKASFIHDVVIFHGFLSMDDTFDPPSPAALVAPQMIFSALKDAWRRHAPVRDFGETIRWQMGSSSMHFWVPKDHSKQRIIESYYHFWSLCAYPVFIYKQYICFILFIILI